MNPGFMEPPNLLIKSLIIYLFANRPPRSHRMRQQPLAEEGFEKYRKLSRPEQFINEMDQIIPCAELSAVIKQFYPRGTAGSVRL